jgi:DNA polymerase III sliding clamp (beta) subunit (PCNA family)
MPGVANKEIIEQSTYISFGSNHIWTNNDEISVSQKFDSGITGSIKAKEFYSLLSKIPSDKINIDQSDSKLSITAQIKTKDKDDNETVDYFEACVMVSDKTIDRKEIDPPARNSKQWKLLPKNFARAATFCVFSASKNMIRPELTTIFFTNDEEGGVAISCDAYRGTMYYLEEGIKIETPFLLPANVAKYMSIYNPTKYLVGDSWLHFINNEDTVLSCRIIAGEYPEEIWEFFEINGDKIKLPEGFGDVVKRTETLVVEEFDQDRYLTLTIDKGSIQCLGSGTIGYVKETKPIAYEGKRIEMKVHPALLADILKYHSEMVIGERLLFEAEDFQHAILLCEDEESQDQ